MTNVVSELKRSANRANAAQSTGPRTPAGKAASSCNNLKHGLLSHQVVVTTGDGAEGRAAISV